MSGPSISNVPSDVAPNSRGFLTGMRNAVLLLLGQTGTPSDWAARQSDLTGTGAFTNPGGVLAYAGNPRAFDTSAYPTPITGLTATSMFGGIIVSWNPSTYTQGGGEDHALIYAATGSTETFANAVLIGTTQGQSFIDACQLGVTRSYWVESVAANGNAQQTPTGGVNGVQATVGLVGTANLGPAIITAAQIAAGSVDPTKFAVNTEPVALVSSVPATKSTTTIFDTVNNQIYTWNGLAYTAATAGAVAAANVTGQLTASQIASINAAQVAGQLTAAQIASITASQLTGQITSTQISNGAVSTPQLAAGAVTAAQIAAGTITASQIAAATITGTQIAAGSISAGNIAAGTITAGNIAAGTITATQIAAGALTAAQIAAGTITAAQLAANTITAGQISAGAIGATQISAGAIGATQLAAGAITAGSAAIANGAIQTAQIGDAAITDALVANMSATKLTSGSIAVGSTIQSSNYVAGTQGWMINGTLAEFGSVFIRDVLTLQNSQITINGSGQLVGIGSGAGTSVANGNISISAGGVLSGGGGGTVTAPGIGAVQTSLANAPGSILNGNISLSESGGTLSLNGAGSTSVGTLVTSNNPITAANAGQFLATASIGNAYIGNAAVNSLQIAGHAVSVVSASYAPSTTGAFVTITVAASDIPSGATTVPIVIWASMTIDFGTVFDIGYNQAWNTAGNLRHETLSAGCWAITMVVNAGAGTYTFGCFNGNACSSSGAVSYSGIRPAIAVSLAKR